MFNLAIFQPLQVGKPLEPIIDIDLNPDIAECTFSTVNPGGYGTLDLRLQMYVQGQGPEFRGLPQPLNLVPFAHVELRNGQYVAFEGRVMGIDRNNAGLYSGFQAMGYGLEALGDQYIISGETGKKTSGAIIQDVISDAAPLLVIDPNNPAMWQDPGLYHAKSEYTALYPQDVVNAVIREGGKLFAGITTTAGGLGSSASAAAWDWLVYEGRRVKFTPRLPPAGTPDDPYDWWAPFDSRVQWHEDYHSMVGRVSIRFQNLDEAGSGENISPPAIDTDFEGRYKIVRSAIIEGGQMRGPSALTFAQTYLANQNTPAIAVNVMRAQLQSLQIPAYGGSDVLGPWHVRAGDWLQIGQEPALPIISTQFDMMSEVLNIECGQPLKRGSLLVHTLTRVADHVIRHTNPITGARA